MKKNLIVIVLILCFSLFVGCDNSNKYEIDKDVKITTNIEYEEMASAIEKLNINGEKYVTMNLKMTRDSLNGVENLSYVIMLKREKGILNGKVDLDLKYYNFEMYIKDNVIYVNHDQIAQKVKTNIVNPSTYTFDVICNDDKNYKGILEGFLENISSYLPDFVCGYDKKGNGIIEYITEDIKFRFVFNENKPIYLYASSGNYSYEYKFSYDKPSIKKPSGFNDEDYKSISWKDFVSLGL